jgi:hypothetical protein
MTVSKTSLQKRLGHLQYCTEITKIALGTRPERVQERLPLAFQFRSYSIRSDHVWISKVTVWLTCGLELLNVARYLASSVIHIATQPWGWASNIVLTGILEKYHETKPTSVPCQRNRKLQGRSHYRSFCDITMASFLEYVTLTRGLSFIQNLLSNNLM